MANSTPRTILLKACCGVQDEALASGIFSPGHLIAKDSNGKVLKHATEGGFAMPRIATEAVLNQGKTIDDAYAVGDLAFYREVARGEHVQAFLKAGANYAQGDLLMSAGDGTLKKVSSPSSGVTVKQALFEVVTALNLSASGAVSTRTSVRAL